MKKMTFIVCAAMLASAVLFTGCKKDENAPEKKNEVVKTEFSITLPQQATKRYMKGRTVQNAGLSDFNGITGIVLVPFAEQDSIKGAYNRLGGNILLTGDVTSADASKPSSAKVYTDVNIPLTTGSFLFYGKSAQTGEKAVTGSILASNLDATNPSGFAFDLEEIKSDYSSLLAASGNGGKLLAYLNSIARATNGTKAWYQFEEADGDGMRALFATFSGQTEDSKMKGMHVLSSFAVERTVSDLYRSLTPLYASSSIAKAIRDSIASTTYVNSVSSAGDVQLRDALRTFPEEAGLPQGAIDIKWNTSANRFVEGDYNNMAHPDTYTYPAQLWYTVNSTIQCSNQSKRTMYDNTNTWKTILDAHDDGVSVSSRTRAVAIKDSIQYAVARLDVRVQLSAATLVDNSETALGEVLKEDVDCSAGFPVTAVLVGGQKQVGYDFKPKAGAVTSYTIFDKDTAAVMTALAGGFTPYNHTLVFENGNEDVMMAVEMINTAADFYGIDNQLIPHNGKFYVVAKLQVANANKTAGQVFKQDYITKADLTLKNLKSAYSSIPDLRTPELELGFSVNLEWKNGNTYTVDFE